MENETFTYETVIKCDCGAPMFPNISTGDEEGYGWSCLTPGCGDYSGTEIEVEDLVAVNVPRWVAERLITLVDYLAEEVSNG